MEQTKIARILPEQYRPVLAPMDRLSEALFGLIMVLSATCSLSVASAGRAEVRVMFISALGCSVAWGIVDAVMHLLSRLVERRQDVNALRALRTAATPAEAQRLIAEALPPMIASLLRPLDDEDLQRRLKELPEPPKRARLAREDWRGAGAIFLLVFLSIVPVAVPFLLLRDPHTALRASNATAILMLFIMGVRFGKDAGFHRWRMGLGMVLLGTLLVGITVALGG